MDIGRGADLSVSHSSLYLAYNPEGFILAEIQNHEPDYN